MGTEELKEKIAKELYEQFDRCFIVHKIKWEDTDNAVKNMYFVISDRVLKTITRHNYEQAFGSRKDGNQKEVKNGN